MKKRCPWPGNNQLMIKYHDTEWGVPKHEDKVLFEYLLLDSFQAGLSWQIILNKRGNFKKSFSNFNPKVIAKYKTKKINQLLADPGIVRNRLKIKAAVQNAKEFLKIQKEFKSFNNYLWNFVKNKPIQSKFKNLKQLPSKTIVSDEISKDLKSRGFKFVGSTTIYAFIQGAGLVNDHIISCFRYKAISRMK